MWDNSYSMTSIWTLDASMQELAAVIQDPTDLPRWWSPVYRSVCSLTEFQDRKGESPVNQKYLIRSRGLLPYQLTWIMTVVDVQQYEITFRSEGDFHGTGVWRFSQFEHRVQMTFEWNVIAEKKLLRFASRFLKPVFTWNHRWAMRVGRFCLQQEIYRRRSSRRSKVPALLHN